MNLPEYNLKELQNDPDKLEIAIESLKYDVRQFAMTAKDRPRTTRIDDLREIAYAIENAASDLAHTYDAGWINAWSEAIDSHVESLDILLKQMESDGN